MTVPKSLRTPGVYDIKTADSLLQRFAINNDARESDLARLETDDARVMLEAALQAEVTVLRRDEVLAEKEQLNQEYGGAEIWNVFVLIALVFLVAEMLLASRWKPAPAAA